jgi:hypothetical protein
MKTTMYRVNFGDGRFSQTLYSLAEARERRREVEHHCEGDGGLSWIEWRVHDTDTDHDDSDGYSYVEWRRL